MNITKYQRHAIREKILEHKFAARRAAFDTEEQAIAAEIYRTVVSEQDERAAVAIMKRHPTMIRQICYWSIGFVEGVTCGRILSLADYRPDADMPRFKDMSDEHKAKVMDLFVRKQAFLDEYESDAQVLGATLERFRTLRKVQVEWPEIMPFVRDVLGQPEPVNLPMVNKEDLNSRFDLPVELKEAA